MNTLFSQTSIQLDEGVQFGLGLFETIAVVQNQAIFPEKHLARLDRSAAFLKLPSCAERGLTAAALNDYLLAHPLPTGSALKILYTRDNLLFLPRSNPYTEATYKTGFCMDFSTVRRNETSPLVAHKTMNYGDCILEKRDAAAHGLQERIFLNTKGQICEGTVTNFFAVCAGKLYTPSISCGLLPGILREYLIETYEVTEAVLYPKDLISCEECFVTNSLMGIMPVRQIRNITFSTHTEAIRLQQEYQHSFLRIGSFS